MRFSYELIALNALKFEALIAGVFPVLTRPQVHGVIWQLLFKVALAALSLFEALAASCGDNRAFIVAGGRGYIAPATCISIERLCSLNRVA
ncbi:hypothetical protein KUF54_07480 [Comamonas sp. Y33R10-2]|uniref:hypothetical protein n=1 Tax=Comamonas sp. Y33R10-2 TaxID=2853257 RepID=UPI001C5CA9E3|nr:hypothetical protein [Comamonas sp. Y33R10-2]QXZ11022.1 hypothetical protein KUF54_07480 [Comamonas sp. Y33R10-2]